MAILENDILTKLSFSIYENKGVYALLLGSGLSRAASIPTGWEITLDLIRRIALAQSVEAQNDWAKWYRDNKGGKPNYSAMLEELAPSPDERRSILHSYIEPTEEDREQGRKLPTAAHRAIAQLVRAGYFKVIITTNFDRLMENALREIGIEPTVVASVDALSGAEPIAHSVCYILKLHGDYKNARILNTEAELSTYPAEYNSLLDRVLDEFGLIVCGWSGEWDHALRSAVLRAPNRRYPLFWSSRGEIGSGGQELIVHRRGTIAKISDADSFFSVLSQQVEILEKTHRQNPQNIDLIVSATKRYLAKPEYRIQLNELFAKECDRLIDGLNSGDFGLNALIGTEEFTARVKQYESLSEAVTLMAGLVGRWGEDADSSLVVDAINAIFAHANKNRSGYTAWIELQTYPAVLLFTGYCLGLSRAKRWRDLHSFLKASVVRPYSEPEAFGSKLFLWSWAGGDNDYWKFFSGLDQRRTPLSDHLRDVFESWSKPFVGIMAEFDLLFARFEVITSISFLDNLETAILKATHAQPEYQNFAFMPVGRTGWNRETRDIVLKELKAADFVNSLLKAGFARGSQEHFELAIENFKRIAGRMR